MLEYRTMVDGEPTKVKRERRYWPLLRNSDAHGVSDTKTCNQGVLHDHKKTPECLPFRV